MNIHIQDIIHATQHKFGLDDYHLHKHELYREVTPFLETTYYLSMEWYPPQAKKPMEDDTNPEGTAVISYDLTTEQYTSAIFVHGKSYANSPVYSNISLDEVIKWIERDTGLVYDKQFRLTQEQNNQYRFHECVNGVPVSPSGQIEIHFDEDGRLVQYSKYGLSSAKSVIHDESFTLTLEQIEPVAKQQLKLFEYPAEKEQRFLPLYGIEEVYITNDASSVIPFELSEHSVSRLSIDQVIEWEQPSTKPVEEEYLNWHETISIEQAMACEPHPDSLPITEMQQQQAIVAVTERISQLYPNDSGQWILKTLQRHMGYIQAVMRETYPGKQAFQRKITMFIDTQRHVAVNAMDNLPFLQMFDEFQAPGKVVISRDEAYQKLKKKSFIELTPVYVYHPELKKYVLCGKLDCPHAVNAANGEVMELNSI